MPRVAPSNKVECPVCGDGLVLGMVPDEDRAWFAARHKHEHSKLPPSLEPRRK